VQALPEHGLGIRFAAAVSAGQYGICPNVTIWTSGAGPSIQLFVVRNYIMDDTIGLGGVRTKMAIKLLDCVISPPDNSGITNHVELKISQNQIDIYATDAGVAPSPGTLRRIAVVTVQPIADTRIDLAPGCSLQCRQRRSTIAKTTHVCLGQCGFLTGPFTYRISATMLGR